MSKKSKISSILVVTAAMFLATGVNADDSESGFLDDYSILEPIAGTDARVYNAPGAFENFKNYKAVMIDQPEFIIAADSKYRGVKPDEAKAVADFMRQKMSEAVSKTLPVVDRAGPGVLYVGIAASNIHLAKKKRGILGYTPAGFVVGSAVSAGEGMQQKIVLQNMVLEIKVLDSQTQELLAAAVDKIDPGSKKPGESWADEDTVMEYWSKRFHCRLDNAGKPKDQWQNCEAKLPE
jgi:hypothetical protein